MQNAWVPLSFAGPIAFAVGAAAVKGWQPWEVVALVGALGAAAAAGAWALAWYAVQTRRAELAALSDDERAAKLLGETLGAWGAYVSAPEAREIWAAFVALPSDAKRAMTLALVGDLAQRDSFDVVGVGAKALAVARSFHPSAAREVLATDAGRLLAAALARCGIFLNAAVAEEVWRIYHDLPREGKGALAVHLDRFLGASAIAENSELSYRVLEEARGLLDKFPDPNLAAVGAP